MDRSIVISLDAMGGDHAPRVVVEALRSARLQIPDIRFILFGDRNAIGRYMDDGMKDYVEVRHTDQVIASDDKPSQALRRGKKSSMRLAIDAVRDGEAQGVVSGGNTGALMAMSLFSLRPIAGIDRPAIAGFMPTMRGESVMLDLGANAVCDETNLVQFALLGADFCRAVLGRETPSVGLLNMGEEELKGDEVVRGAAERLRAMDNPGFRYHGFVEGTDITRGVVDVVVTDGFSGNVALKSHEGAARMVAYTLRQAMTASWAGRLGAFVARGAFRRLRERLDPNGYNGGVFLGLNGVVVKSHGGANATGFTSAVRLAADMVRDGMVGRITRDFEQAGFKAEDPQPNAGNA
ncbi:phosphate acyltransferase PlsX [Minwuia thermotolerans]|uniref:Phosphate acyltransferase n=1 Tax=Minwuia thermotolerans TaxID=2056226 RepID=A0A2M9G1M9_9PROT|nr:phosphate acyltransferase PlsX [Minwuia thermotolerans]PJK29613.1 phosphate acyltransferase [Minwuia thermotolerans]